MKLAPIDPASNSKPRFTAKELLHSWVVEHPVVGCCPCGQEGVALHPDGHPG